MSIPLFANILPAKISLQDMILIKQCCSELGGTLRQIFIEHLDGFFTDSGLRVPNVAGFKLSCEKEGLISLHLKEEKLKGKWFGWSCSCSFRVNKQQRVGGRGDGKTKTPFLSMTNMMMATK